MRRFSELFQYRSLLAGPVSFNDLSATGDGSLTSRHVLASSAGSAGGPRGGAQPATFWRYWADVVPALWRLTRRTQSRVFQQRTVPEILRQVLAEEWRLDVVFRLAEDYPRHNYCVQYRESDFAFISRLMEEEGIGYFFEHSPEGHRLVISDPSVRPTAIAAPHVIAFDEFTLRQVPAPRLEQFPSVCRRAGLRTITSSSRSNLARKSIREPRGGKCHGYAIYGSKNDMLASFDYPAGLRIGSTAWAGVASRARHGTGLPTPSDRPCCSGGRSAQALAIRAMAMPPVHARLQFDLDAHPMRAAYLLTRRASARQTSRQARHTKWFRIACRWICRTVRAPDAPAQSLARRRLSSALPTTISSWTALAAEGDSADRTAHNADSSCPVRACRGPARDMVPFLAPAVMRIVAPRKGIGRPIIVGAFTARNLLPMSCRG